jgi:hypothetical protein
VKRSKLFIKKFIKDKIYWDGKVSLSNARNKGLHKVLDCDPVPILTVSCPLYIIIGNPLPSECIT